MNPNHETVTLRVTGMTCGGCENAVKRTLMKLPGVETVSASHAAQSVRVEYTNDLATLGAIRSAIEALGYHVENPEPGA
jgi:copper chaperone CopZ